ncbi:hypothetical protein BH11BAC1_BH11BAC1_07820 [soil metagenome]
MKQGTIAGNLKQVLFRNKIAIWLFYVFGIYGRRLKSKYRNLKMSEYWQDRINKVCECPDNNFIAKVDHAGKIIGDVQLMHNGIKINFGSYYGMEMVRLLELNSGIHEPQEERVFAEVLKKIPDNATMIELGSYWSFYSMWFQKEIKGAKNYMIESDYFCFLSGIHNFRLNKMKGVSTNALVAQTSQNTTSTKSVCIDDYVKSNGIEYIDLLHSDIQGYEYEMLLGAKNTFDDLKVGYVFISTHSNELHSKCLDWIRKYNFKIIASANIDESYSWDGVLIAAAPSIKDFPVVEISKRK